MVGLETLGEGKAMTGEEHRDFERRFRRSIEQRPLAESEDTDHLLIVHQSARPSAGHRTSRC